MTKYEKGLIFVLVFMGIFLFFFWRGYINTQKDLVIKNEQQVLEEINLKNKFNKLSNEIGKLELSAFAVSVYDISSNRKVYGRNDNQKLPLASLAKTMTVIVAFKNITEKEITISSESLKQDGIYGLSENEVWDIYDLAKFALISSSNDAAYALAEGDVEFLKKMNDKAQEIGMINTNFKNVTGLDIDSQNPGNYGTAQDANKLAIYALKKYPLVFKETALKEKVFQSKSGFIYNIQNTNTSLSKLPNVLFSKTGLTLLAGGNLTVIFKDKKDTEFVITVLGATPSGRFSDVEKIVNLLYNYDYEKSI